MGLDGDSMKRKKILLILLILLLVAGRFSFESFIDLSLLSEGRFLLGIAFIALIAVHLSKGTTINKKSLTSLIFLLLVLIFFYIVRKSTRLNSSHVAVSYAVFCFKNK